MRWVWCLILVLVDAAAGVQESLPYAPVPHPAGLAQRQDPPPSVPIHPSTDKGLSIPGFSYYGGAQCDAKGNLYFRIGSSRNDTRILRITPDGADRHVYDLPSDYASEGKSAFVAFRVTERGNVYALVKAKDGIHVFSWKPDANKPANTRLDTPEHISPLSFAAFESGTVLLLGYYDQDAPEGLRSKTFFAELDSSGRLRINFSREGIAPSGKRSSLDAPATMDEKGLLYMGSGDEIVVVSESGEVVRRLVPIKPSPEYMITRIQVAKGRLGVWFFKPEPSKPSSVRLAVLEATSGDILRLFEPDAELGNNAICFTGDAFTFFKRQGGYVRILTARVP